MAPEKEPPHVKLGVVARLKTDVHYSQSNKALAAMVSDFAKVTNKSTGRTVTKVGSYLCLYILFRLIVLLLFFVC
jgi:casein kinase 1